MKAILIGSAVAALVVVAACANMGEVEKAASAAACPLAQVQAGLTEQTITSAGVERSYALYVPASYTGTAPVPLVFDFHGSGATPAEELRLSGLVAAADTRGFIVAAPAAAMQRPNMGGFTWNVPQQQTSGDDVALVNDIIAALEQSHCIDAERIYAMGYSGGARLVSELACRMPERIAAISAVAGLRHPFGAEGACLADGGATPIISFHGQADEVNAYAAGIEGSSTWTYGVEDALARWAAAMRCGAPREEAVAPGIARVTYPNCAEGAEIVHYRMSEAGHIWPGTHAQLHPAMGPTENRINATALSLEFFERMN